MRMGDHIGQDRSRRVGTARRCDTPRARQGGIKRENAHIVVGQRGTPYEHKRDCRSALRCRHYRRKPGGGDLRAKYQAYARCYSDGIGPKVSNAVKDWVVDHEGEGIFCPESQYGHQAQCRRSEKSSHARVLIGKADRTCRANSTRAVAENCSVSLTIDAKLDKPAARATTEDSQRRSLHILCFRKLVPEASDAA